jgi:hypothetical protein
MTHSVTITAQGRSGAVVCRDHGASLACCWQFGGADVVAILPAVDAAARAAGPVWSVGCRTEGPRFVAGELIRQQAPGGRAELGEPAGMLRRRQVGPPRIAPPTRPLTWPPSRTPTRPPSRPLSWIGRLTDLTHHAVRMGLPPLTRLGLHDDAPTLDAGLLRPNEASAPSQVAEPQRVIVSDSTGAVAGHAPWP